MLLEVFKEHNKKYRELLNKDVVLGTVLRYERTARYLEEFMKVKYHFSDIPLKSINLEFVKEEELNKLIEKDFTITRMEEARDIFVFCGLTGLAFTDVQHLTPEHIFRDMDGSLWIRKTREKTDNMCNIPLLDLPFKLIQKYQNHPECICKGVVMPVPCNQRMNSYLKEIADACGIQKTLTTHIARHTFACLAIANKVSTESIAKMLGHTDIRTTKIYARVLDRIVTDKKQILKGARLHHI